MGKKGDPKKLGARSTQAVHKIYLDDGIVERKGKRILEKDLHTT